MKALKCLIVAVAVVGLFTVGAQAAHRPDVYQIQAEQARAIGDLQGIGGVREMGCNCDDVEDLGVLGAGSTYVDYSVAGCNDDFAEDPACPAPCGWFYYTDGYMDGILTFQVSVAGPYTISVCADGNDNNVSLRAGGDCPGDACVGQDDDSCGGGCWAPYQAELTGMALAVGVQYYVIVDYGIGTMMISGPCTDSSECQDGQFCNGEEVCAGGFCAAGTNPCEAYQTCDEVNDVCVNPPAGMVYWHMDDSGYFWRPGVIPFADDWFIEHNCDGNDDLVSYTWAAYGHPGYGCTYYDVNTELYANTTGKVCTGDWITSCVEDTDCDPVPGGLCVCDYCPGLPIPGTACSLTGLATGWQWITCDVTPNTVDCPNSVCPDDGVPDVWVIGQTFDDSPDPAGCSGPIIGANVAVIGWSDNVWGYAAYGGAVSAACDPWGLTWFGGNPPAQFVGEMWCEACGPCCFPDGSCVLLTEAGCLDDMGVYVGDWTPFPPGDANVCAGSIEACCFPDSTCADMDAFCCLDAGGEPKGPGTSCLGMEACCFPNGACHMADALCCLNEGGVPKGVGTVCLGTEACCFPNGSCTDVDALCCENEGGIPLGPGSMCEGDGDGDGVDGFCGDNCPDDPLKLDTLQCGCNLVPDEWMASFNVEADEDGDGVSDCCDECPFGVWDPDFEPSILGGNTCEPKDGCDDAIPTVTEWGLVILALLLLVAGKVYFGRRRAMA